MPLFRPSHINSASPDALDLRKAVSTIYPREGVFPDPVTILPAGIAYGNGGWNVAARPFTLNSKRGGAPFSMAYGAAQGGNDSAGTAWTIAAAPGSGVRVDRLWVRFRDLTQGESLTGGLAVPEFGVTAGTPAIQPLPAGAVEIAQVSTPAGAASIAGSTITQTYAFANVLGGPIVVRALADRANVGAAIGEEVLVLATGLISRRIGTTGTDADWSTIGATVELTASPLVNNDGVPDTITPWTQNDAKSVQPGDILAGVSAGDITLRKGTFVVTAMIALNNSGVPQAVNGRSFLELSFGEANTFPRLRTNLVSGEDSGAISGVITVTDTTPLNVKMLATMAPSLAGTKVRFVAVKIG